MNNYNWDNKEIIRTYFKKIFEYIKSNNEREKQELLIDLDNLKDMIMFSIFKLPSIMPSKINAKKYFDLDKSFLEEETTKFQRKKLSECIPLVLKSNITIDDFSTTYKNDKIVEEALNFLNNLNPKLHEFLISSIKNNRLKINDNKHKMTFSGTTYSLQCYSFLEILLNSYSNPFITLNHETIHGYINDVTNRKFDIYNKYILYREVGSILSEIYSNNYLYINNLISYNEYVTNFIDVFNSTSYNDIEIIDVLFYLASNPDQKNSITEVKKFIREKQKKNPTYDIKINELIENPLKKHLIYLYSAMIAISIYDNFKDDQKGAIDAALDIMISISPNNEEELFDKYKLNPERALVNYVDECNSLVKKKTN